MMRTRDEITADMARAFAAIDTLDAELHELHKAHGLHPPADAGVDPAALVDALNHGDCSPGGYPVDALCMRCRWRRAAWTWRADPDGHGFEAVCTPCAVDDDRRRVDYGLEPGGGE